MSTRPILFRFNALNNEGCAEWTQTYPIPTSLIVPPYLQNTPVYQEQFRTTITSIMPQFQAECDSKAGKHCCNCNGPASTSVLTPCSYLHVPNEPFINVLVQPICATPVCRNAAQLVMNETMNEGHGDEARGSRCEVCWKPDGIKKCTKCKSVAYCGVDCQKKDWKTHKKVCARLAEKGGTGQ
jgi:hypothetical protein